MKSWLSRWILIAHRYLGVVVGTLMTIWCLSGFVMMYQGFPSTTDAERAAALPPLDLSNVQRLDTLPIAPGEDVGDARIEMVNYTPVLRLRGRDGPSAYRLDNGEPLELLKEEEISQLAQQFTAAQKRFGDAVRVERLTRKDQWTLQGVDPSLPVYKVTMADDARSAVYISGYTGAVLQDTSRKERVLSWLGAIPHWLYPRVLRDNGPLWTQIVIWSSVLGIFLTVTGLYVGIGRYFGPKKQALSPFKGLWYWHHVFGLFLGLITLTWVFSGLMTMGPWGVLSPTRTTIREDISGPVIWRDVRSFIENAREKGLPVGTRLLRPAPLGDHLYMLAYNEKNVSVRLDSTGNPKPLDRSEIIAATTTLPVRKITFISTGDAYHYGFKDRPSPSAFKIYMADNDTTLVYINAETGQISRIADRNTRISRWLRNGLHSLDFIPQRPLWDAITLLLLGGVTFVCATGAWMSFRRVKRDVKVLIKRRHTTRRTAKLRL